MTQLKRILVATDFGDSSEKAVAMAVDLARATDAALTLLHVIDYPMYYSYAFEPPIDLLGQMEGAAEAMLAKEVTRVRRELPRANGLVKKGAPTDVVLAFAETDAADLLVVGTHGRRGVTRWVLGSVAEKLVRLSPRPVLTVRGDVRAERAS